MRYRVPAVFAAIRILRYLQAHQDDRSALSEITRALDLNKSTCHCILKTMEAEGLLVYDEMTKTYRLGPGLISLGASAARHNDYATVATAFAKKLVQEVRFACLVTQLVPGGQIVVVDKAESLKDIKVTVAVGEHFPITASPLGKSLLAWMPEDEAKALLMRADRTSFTPKSIHSTVDVDGILRELPRVRELGYSESRGEYYHRNAVASPVFGPDGEVVLVLCVLGFSSELADGAIPFYGAKLRDTTVAITEAIGGSLPASFPRFHESVLV